MRPNAKRPNHRGDGRAVKGDQVTAPIADKTTRETAIEQAARWYAEHRHEVARPLVPNLASRFDLTVAEAAKALGMAGRLT